MLNPERALVFNLSSSDEPVRFLLSGMAPPPCASLDLPKMAEDEGA